MANPFKPTAGMTPPVLIGREDDLEEFEMALDNGVGDLGRLAYVTGPRGIGKTALLNAYGDIARDRKWDVIDETADQGFLDRLVEALTDTKTKVRSVELPTVRLDLGGTPVGLSTSLGGISLEPTQRALTFRRAAGQRLDVLEKKNRGLLITLDEVQASDITELRALATGMQHLIRERRNVAFVFAGLPSMVEDVLNDNVLTFLRRANRTVLSGIPIPEVHHAFRTIITTNGKQASDEVLDTLSASTRGYPFMIQLVGYWAWAYTKNSNVITMETTQKAIRRAQRGLGDMVHAPEIDGLSSMQKEYLLAMAQDDGPSATAKIAKRLDRDIHYANVYRTQLIKEDVIYSPAWGQVDFKLPYMRDYLREHGAYHFLHSGTE